MRRNLYGTTLASSREIDLRKWFDNLIYGTGGGIPHGHRVLIRRARLDSARIPIPCTCVDPLTREGTTDCQYCDGEGFLWDEEWRVVFSGNLGSVGGFGRQAQHLPPGLLNVNYKIFYLRFDTPISTRDRIIEVSLDEEGEIATPLKRETIYRPSKIHRARSDYGRVEYIAVYCREDEAIRR